MGSLWSAGKQQQRAQLPGYMYESLKRARGQNPSLQMLPGNKAVHAAPGSKRPVKIVKSLVGLTLVWALAGCLPGKQHMRECVPHTIICPVCLRCPWCDYDEDEWVALGKQKIPASELKLMAQLSRTGWDKHARWQAKLQFWAAPVDFLLRCERAVVLQADGNCHFAGLYEETATCKLAADLRFCVAAVTAGVSVVRVHATEVDTRRYPAYLPVAVEAAAAHRCIVLSPGYTTTYMYDKGLLVTYAAVLAGMLPGCRVVTDNVNNCVIYPK